MSSPAGDATSGVAIVTTRRVDRDRVADYRMWSEKVQACLERAPGFISAEQLPAVSGQQDFWTQIVRFSNKDYSARWARSPELAALVKEIEPYTENAEVSAVRIGKNDWLNFGLSTKSGPGAPPKWKQLIAGVMALYPTVIIVNQVLRAACQPPIRAIGTANERDRDGAGHAALSSATLPGAARLVATGRAVAGFEEHRRCITTAGGDRCLSSAVPGTVPRLTSLPGPAEPTNAGNRTSPTGNSPMEPPPKSLAR